jgi:hypothetical protein
MYRIIIILSICAAMLPMKASAARNSCYVSTLSRGQYVTQTSGTVGTIDIYVNGSYVTTISRLNQAWYATRDKKARVRGYDSNGLVC